MMAKMAIMCGTCDDSEQSRVMITVEIRDGCGSSSVPDDHSLSSNTSDSTDYSNVYDPNLSSDLEVGEHWSPSVPEDTIHHSLPSDVLPVDTTNESESGLGWQNLGFSDGFDLGSSSVAHAFDNND
ncbi:hypothetical protein ACB092_09G028300 [Castanea dentata]